ncbi:hypothetical protein [Anaeromassilibacillus sp. SJQ-1]|uniref:hypothetical protein n=1 Tax=Anaeromassilibacillus sp. SJQ-1 TaxID=3375419 RepID=UPI00398956CB
MICGALLSQILKRLGLADYIDRPTISRIAGVALDFLVCSAIAITLFQKSLHCI